jgi:hypothetical protein
MQYTKHDFKLFQIMTYILNIETATKRLLDIHFK